MSLLSVEDALARIIDGIADPTPPEHVPLAACLGRTLAGDVAARRTQPPFAASAMDGYAVRQADLGAVPARLRVVGESAAGRRLDRAIGPGEAARIFTGAPIPDGADTIVIQENTIAGSDGFVSIEADSPAGRYIRPAGLDFSLGETLLRQGDRLDPRRVALAAAMGHPVLPVRRKPRVAIIATGDELTRPGEPLGPDQIVASNLYAIAGMVEEAGGEALDLGIAGDSLGAINARVTAAREAEADILVTLGGASVGDHDLVQEALRAAGMELGFWRIAMRPGKPLMHGRLGPMLFLGLPGNPVSSMVCSLLFLEPAVRALLGDPAATRDRSVPALLASDVPANDSRQDYLRARLVPNPGNLPLAEPFTRQDSSMLRLFADADALIVRHPNAPAAAAGSSCRVLLLQTRV